MEIISASAVQSAMLRLELGVMQLAKLANIPVSTICAIHKQDKAITLPTLARLAKALGVDPATLIKSR
jgi:plasmid maintenance system antidote protein VapI